MGAVAASHAQTPAAAAPLTVAQERALKRGDSFRECENCPEMVVVPAGSFTMGSPEGENDRSVDEGPQHVVTISKPFAVGKFHVTRDEYAVFAQETGYAATMTCYKRSGTRDGSWHDPGYAQEGSHPVVCVTWDDAKAYVNWLAKKTGKPYRLLSEAEWEYAARGKTHPGTYPRFWFGNDKGVLCRYANGITCHILKTSPAGKYKPNAFRLYDMTGNAWQWTEDCHHDSYQGAPTDGSAWTAGTCNSGPSAQAGIVPGPDRFAWKIFHAVRGGSWFTYPRNLRAAARDRVTDTDYGGGFRLARTLTP
jgi:formylglycine-generating enzyme required for sulfatase activity